jgi:hypothetical protein
LDRDRVDRLGVVAEIGRALKCGRLEQGPTTGGVM